MMANSSDESQMNVSDLGNSDTRTFLTGNNDPVLSGVDGEVDGQSRIHTRDVSDQIAEVLRRMQEYRIVDNKRNDEVVERNKN